jgi:aldehyde:ferredoxin oxidoreductase
LVSVEPIPDEVAREFVGGRGLGIKYLFDELRPGIDSLGAENKLLLLTGPLAGTSAQSFSRWIAMTKSPLTGAIARAVGGGDFGAWIRFAGFDFIVLEGKSPKPCYLYLEKGRAEIHTADDLWGLDTEATQRRLQERHGPRTRVACIGPAGERLVRYATIASGRRTASRCGVGTVMGSKNLKAVAINAQGRPEVHDPEAFKKSVQTQIKTIGDNPLSANLRKSGTIFAVPLFYEMGLFPVRNFQEGRLEGIEQLGPDSFAQVKVGNFGCYSCMINCGQAHRVTSGPFSNQYSEGPEYETIWAFGGQIGSTNKEAVIAADCLCDLMGLDTISTGNSIGFAYELFDRGILTTSDTDGLELTWGNHEAMLALVKMIAERRGLGEVLGQGVKRAAETIGQGAEAYAMHVKGLEFPAYQPRAAKGEALAFATSNIGANHMYGRTKQELAPITIPRAVDRFADEGKGDIVVFNQKRTAVRETGIMCGFTNRVVPLELLGQLLSAATGVDALTNEDYLHRVGERILCLERAFNVREGFDRKDDTLPARMLTEPLKNAGPATGQVVRKLDTLLDEYYDELGYSLDGVPKADTLRALGLHSVIGQIAQLTSAD